MWCIGGLLIYLAIAREMEPSLLLPMGFGAILVNLPFSGAITQGAEQGVITILYNATISNELLPLLLFIGIGAMIDFGPLLTNPKLMFFGAAAQFGIFFTLCLARLIGFDLQRRGVHRHHRRGRRPDLDLCCRIFQIATISARSSWPPTPIWRWCPLCSRPLSALVTTKQERMIRMQYNQREISKTTCVSSSRSL